MDEVEAKFLFKQVISAIHYCHSRCITHRDIKLENILLNDKKDKVKLIDFGFSTCIPNDKKVKLFCGTPSYMAPEIVSKKDYTRLQSNFRNNILRCQWGYSFCIVDIKHLS